MPLTLECNCSDTVTICELIALYLEYTADYEQFGPVSYGSSFSLTTNPTGLSEDLVYAVTDPSGVGSIPLSLGLADLANWTSMKAYFGVDSSLSQSPSSSPARWTFTFWIRLHYECTDLSTATVVKVADKFASPGADLGSSGFNGCECTDIILRTRMLTNGVQWVDAEGDLNQQSGAVSISYTSSPLGSCNGCTSEYGPGFIPRPKASYIDVDSSGPICLCAEGGSGNYNYFVRAGVLPAGMTLNAESGCLEGVATGPGSGDVEFGVLDVDTGAEAYVTCGLSKACAGSDAAPGNWMY